MSPTVARQSSRGEGGFLARGVRMGLVRGWQDDPDTGVAESEAEVEKWHTRGSLGVFMRTVGSGVERSAKKQTHMHVANTRSLEKAMWVFTGLGAFKCMKWPWQEVMVMMHIRGSQTHILHANGVEQ